MHDGSAEFKIGFASTALDCTSLNRTTQLLQLISGYAASAILCEALAPAVFLTPLCILSCLKAQAEIRLDLSFVCKRQ